MNFTMMNFAFAMIASYSIMINSIVMMINFILIITILHYSNFIIVIKCQWYLKSCGLAIFSHKSLGPKAKLKTSW